MTDTARLAELRSRRAILQVRDDEVSYVRRVAQARADLARDALKHASDDGDPTPLFIRGGLADGLRDVLSDRLLASGDRAPRPADDFSEHPLSVELDELCAAAGFGRLQELTYTEVEHLVATLDDFERCVSEQRHVVHAELDVLTEELVAALQQASDAGDTGMS